MIENGEGIVDRLKELHQQLEYHFAGGSEEASQDLVDLFFIDHGIDSQGLHPIRELVRSALKELSLDSFHWQSSHLPLLVCAVEVGYEYEGNGTDFWPTLNKSLGHQFSNYDRQRVSHWFSSASEKYKAATPGDSQWDVAFCHISWPITHAVAAKDIRRPFADCLRRFRRDVRSDSLTDETIVTDFSEITTTVGSQRFRTWLDRPQVVAGIIRDLLGGRPLDEAGLFSKSFRDRLIVDLRSEPEIRKAVRQSENRRLRKPIGDRDKEQATSTEDLRFGSFFLCQNDHGCLELCGEMPELPKTIQRELKVVRRRWKVRPWGYPGATPIPSDCLRSSKGHFHVSFSYVARASADSPFFTGTDEQKVDDDARRWLDSVRFPVATLLAFPAMQPGEDSSHCITARRPQQGKIWVVSRRGEISTKLSSGELESGQSIGQVEGGEIHEFDADNAAIRDLLGWPEVNAKTKSDAADFMWLRPSPLSIDSSNFPIYTTDDELGISVTGAQVLTLVLRQGPSELARTSVNEVGTLRLDAKGSYVLSVLREDVEIDSFSFGIIDNKGDGFIEPDPEVPWRAVVSHIDAGETQLSRSDLFNHRLNLDVIGERGIDNLTARLTLTPGEAVATVSLDKIPTRLSANHRVWEQLIQAVSDSVLRSPCDLSLTVEIEGLSKDSWRLQTELQELWWEDSDEGLPVAVNDSSVFQVQRYCVVENKPIDLPADGNPFLSVALDKDGNELSFDARIDLAGDSSLHRSLRAPKKFLRQIDDHKQDPGLRSLVLRYLQLSSASSSSLNAEINRVGAAQTVRSWVLRCLCGSNWHHKSEETTGIQTVNPTALWWDFQHAQKDLLQPPSDEERCIPETLPSLVLDELSHLLPDRWWDGAVSEVDPDEAEPLDSIYQHLIDDDSVIVDADALTRSLRLANEQLCGAILSELVVPVTGGDELLSWHVSDQSISELSSALHQWIRKYLERAKRGRKSWTPAELGIYLNLLLYPERLRREPWESVLEKLLHDRYVARAGAFIAWRIEQNARMSSVMAKEGEQA